MSADVPDGATQRHSRLMELLSFISLYGRVQTSLITSHMLTIFGLKFKTTSDMIRELAIAGVIKEDGQGRWYLTEKQQTIFKRVQAQEKATSTVDQLTKRIDKIKDEELRKRLLKLLSQIWNLLLRAEEKEAEN